MGTNYYLHKKCKYDPKYPGLVGDSPTIFQNVQILNNGYVWNNTYYQTADELNKDYYKIIHIGKNSYGWKFALCVYPDKYETPWSYEFNGEIHNELDVDYLLPEPIKSLDDWKKLFDDPNCTIYDECGEEVSKEEMLRVITYKSEKDTKCARGDRYTTVLEGEGYDLVLSGNDPEKGCVFC